MKPGFSAPKARDVIAQGNALGKGHKNAESAEGAQYLTPSENIEDFVVPLSFRAFSALNLNRTPPGPTAQAVTFRAFGAGEAMFSHLA